MKVKIDKIFRSSRKTLSIEVSFSGEIIVRAPLKLSNEKITDFVNKQSSWILKKLTQLDYSTQSTAEESAYYLGNKYYVIIDKDLKVPFKFEKAFYISDKYARLKQEVLSSWFKVEAHNYIIPKFIEMAEKYSIKFNSVSITKATRKWGSCNNKRNINFSLRLIMADPKAIEYVIVHELAHLIELNHSVNFWNEVKKIMPDYKEHEKYLRLNGHKFHL